MFIAQEKRKENIAEYILYIWQIEDIIRACNFNIEQIEQILINSYSQNIKKKAEIRAWYENLIAMMQYEHLEKSGHLQFIINTVNDLNDLHLKILQSPLGAGYTELFQATLTYIAEFRLKSDNKAINDIHLIFNGLYSLLLLRLQKKEISEGTSDAFNSFSRLIANLAKIYHDVESGQLEL